MTRIQFLVSLTSLTVLSVILSIVSIHTLKVTGVWILTRGVSELLRHVLMPFYRSRLLNMHSKTTDV